MNNFKNITSKENSIIKLVCSLQNSSKARRENNLFVLEGLRICYDAFDNELSFSKLIVSQTAFLKYRIDIEKLSEKSDECFIIPDSLFSKISDTDSPQGIIAVAQTPAITDTKINSKGRYIALENISNPSNLGAIARTAEALGISGIILSKDCCDPFSPKSIRASMGTLLRIPLIVINDFSNNIKHLGLKTYACVVDASVDKINDLFFCDGSLIIIGNEANGITNDTLSNVEKLITIPMKGMAESLNAAVAAAISMWEMMK